MKKIGKFFVGIIIPILLGLLFLVAAIQISNFYGYGTSENLTFTGDENITRNISIYKYASVTSAFMNLSGFSELPWQSDSNIVSGLSISPAKYSKPTVFQRDSTWYLISGAFGVMYGFNWTGSTWQNDSNVISGIPDVGSMHSPTVFQRDSTWYLIQGENTGTFHGFNWTGSTWQNDSNVISGLVNLADDFDPHIFQRDSTWYLIIGKVAGDFVGYNWTGSTWQNDSNVISGLGGEGTGPNPTVFQKNSTWYLIQGIFAGDFVGYNWTGSTWQNDSNVISGLVDVGVSAAPTVFQRDSTWYLISGEFDSFNGFSMNYLTNTYLEVGTPDGNYEWNVTGTFNTAQNKTLDFSSVLNTALNLGACDCIGCSLLEKYCTIPFLFHSDTAGVLEYSAIEINYSIPTWNTTDMIIDNITIELCGEYWNKNIIINGSATVTICADGNLSLYGAGSVILEEGSTINGNSSSELTTGKGGVRVWGGGAEDSGCGSGGGSHNSSSGAGGGTSGTDNNCVGGIAGSTYGIYDSQTSITKGSEGGSNYEGGVWLIITAPNITMDGVINLYGRDGANAVSDYPTHCANGGHGGGSGGQVIIKGHTVNITGANITISGGSGGNGMFDGSCAGGFPYAGGGGGGGAGGMISIFYEDDLINSSFVSDVTGGDGGAGIGTWGGVGTDGESGNVGTLYYSNEDVDLESLIIVTLNSPVDNYASDTTDISFNCSAEIVSDTILVNRSLILYNLDGSINKTNITTGLSGTSHSGTSNLTLVSDVIFNWTCEYCDSAGICDFAINNRTVNVIPFITLESPSNDSWASSTQEFNCSATDGIQLSNMTFYFWNSTGTLNLSTTLDLTGISNSTAYNMTFASTDTYTWGCSVINNNSRELWADNNFTINIDIDNPIVILNAPTDNQYITTQNMQFNYTPKHSTQTVDTCELYGNFTGGWLLNQTNTSITEDIVNTFNQTLIDGSYFWNIKCNTTETSDSAFAISNFTFTLDTVYPSITIDSITPTAGSQTFLFTNSVSDIHLDSCKYSIFDSTGGIDGLNENVSFTCGVDTSPTVTAYGTYNLTIYAEDLVGNENSTTGSFTTSPSVTPPAGGGGGDIIIIVGDNVTGWSLTTVTGGEKYGFIMSRGDSRTKSLIFKNLGETVRPIFIRCESEFMNFCNYLTFSDIFIELPVLKDVETGVDFTLTLPKEMEKGDYIFNIIAEDDFNRTAALTVIVNVETAGILVTLGAKFFTSASIFGLKVPYVLVFFMTWIVVGVIMFYGVFGRTELKNSKIWSFLSGLTLALIAIVFV